MCIWSHDMHAVTYYELKINIGLALCESVRCNKVSSQTAISSYFTRMHYNQRTKSHRHRRLALELLKQHRSSALDHSINGNSEHTHTHTSRCPHGRNPRASNEQTHEKRRDTMVTQNSQLILAWRQLCARTDQAHMQSHSEAGRGETRRYPRAPFSVDAANWTRGHVDVWSEEYVHGATRAHHFIFHSWLEKITTRRIVHLMDISICNACA
jgi:hypothetical protein